MVKIKKIVVMLSALLLLTVIYWQWDNIIGLFSGESKSGSKSTKQELAPIKVITRPVVLTPNNTVYEAIGTGLARASILIYPAVSDQVIEVMFKAEDKVTKDQLLVQLDDRHEKLALRLASVNLKVAANLLKRYETALKEGGVPESEVDAIRADYEAKQVALEQSKLELKDRQVRAPFAGHVGIPRIDPGDRINTETIITGLDDRSVILVDFEIPESLAAELSKTDQLPFNIIATTPAWPNQNFAGEITALDSRLDPERRTIKVRASIDNSKDLLRPGMSFAINWNIKGGTYPTVPEISLQWSREGAYVWIIKDNKAHKTPVEVISREKGNILISGSVYEGDQVVVEGLQRLTPDAKVEILDRESK